jgi:hypothetical protein
MHGDVFESEATTEEQQEIANAWMCRPCEWYWDENRECRRIRARVHQYFVFGETLDCSQWKRDYHSCMAFRLSRDPEHLKAIIASEESRFQKRMESASKNDVWKYRTSPPADWNAPLPDFMDHRTRGSLLEFYSKQNQQSNNKKN